MKNNSKSEKHKGSKSFYAALGISAVMIGSACYFAYSQGNKLVEDYHSGINSSASRSAAVDRKIADIPKYTTTAYTVKSHPTTTAHAVITEQEMETLPEIEVNAEIEAEEAAAVIDEEAVSTAASLENTRPPLADISNILNGFSGSELVKNETTGSWQTHNGTDIAADIGTEVYAVADGEVTSVNNDALWGVTVVIDHHNGFTTKYCGLGSDLAVQQGDKLNCGDVIGVIGGTADIESTVPSHLHIELTHNGKYVDVLSEINQ